MVQNVLVGLVGGVAAAMLFVAPIGGSPLAYPLFFLTGLPIAIAGFGWGNIAALSAVGAGAVVAFVLYNPAITGLVDAAGPLALDVDGVILFAAIFAIPVAWATIAAVQPTTTQDGRGWRPIGRVLAHGAGALALGLLACGVVVGFDVPALTERATLELVRLSAEASSPGSVAPTAAQLAPIVSLVVVLLPLIYSIAGLLIVALDLYLGAKSVGLSERFRRPVEPMWTLDLPPTLPAAFVFAVVVAFAPGSVGYAAEAVAGALGGAVALQGLAVLHALSLGVSWRAPALGAVYAALISVLLTPLTLFLLALLGLAESAFHLRARRTKRPRPNST